MNTRSRNARRCRRVAVPAVLLMLAGGLQAATILRVNAQFPCPGNSCFASGRYADLSWAIYDAATYWLAFGPVEIRVAAGTYRPDSGTANRTLSFPLLNGIAITGGWSSDFSVRNPGTHLTILSGDIGIRDDLSDDSYHVVTARDVFATQDPEQAAILDGFAIFRGHADGIGHNADRGGGLISLNASPWILNCLFTGNQASLGAAVSNAGGQPFFYGCIFDGNHARAGGGAMYNAGGVPLLAHCRFNANEVFNGYGGAMYNAASSPIAQFCIFELNRAAAFVYEQVPGAVGYGGAVHNDGGDPVFLGCRFQGNQALHGGGAVSNRNHQGAGQVRLGNCILTANQAIHLGGGGVFNGQSDLFLQNCTLHANLANTGSEILSFESSNLLRDSIVWGNRAMNRARIVPEVLRHIELFDFDPDFTLRESGGQIVLFGSTLSTTYCDIQGGRELVYTDPASSLEWGTGNFDEPADPLLTAGGTLRSGSPCINRGSPSLIGSDLPADVDGEARVHAGRIDIGADEFSDSDSDQIPDAFEFYWYGSPTAMQANGDPDGDGLNNRTEYEIHSAFPRAPPFHVNAATGNDAWNGRFSIYAGGQNGPLRTLQAAIDRAVTGDSILVAPGVYAGAGNTNLDLNYKGLIIRAPQGPAATRLDGNGSAPLLRHETLTFFPTWIEGFTITRGLDSYGGGLRIDNGRRIWLRNCTLVSNEATTEGGALVTILAETRLKDVVIENNHAPAATAGLLYDTSMELEGDLHVKDGTLSLYSSHVDRADGTSHSLRLDEGAVLRVGAFSSPEPAPPTVIRTDILGLGSIRIDAGQQLIIGGDAEVNLSGQSGGTCTPPDTAMPSQIQVDGSLVVQDNARIVHNRIDVSLLTLGSGADIRYNDISAPLDASGFGGEFFVETDESGASQVSVRCNRIHAVGDRYLDLDPDPGIPPEHRPIIQGNRIEVTVAEGTAGAQGTILELRARDYHCDPAAPEACPGGTLQPNLVPWPDRTQFDVDSYPANNWVLEKLTLQQDAKLNLANRQGFDFNGDHPDVLYVKDLTLEPGAVLNLANQRMYYNTLTLGEGAQVVNVPLLGFSLGIIGMNDDNEFSVRVRRRVTDADADHDPVSPEATPLPRGEIRRLPDGLVAGEGVMLMSTQAEGEPVPATSVAAKGHFTRAGEDAILIIFQYLFQDPNPESELRVRLSGHREVGRSNVEVARIRPEPGRPGSFGSGRFAIFHQSVPRGDLNLTRGTFIELELRSGADPNDPGRRLRATVWIENWDPQITCSQIGRCGDLNNSFAGLINERDYLLLVASCGHAIEPEDPADPQPHYPLWCLDLSGDRYVDMSDLLRWDVFLTTRFNFCAPAHASSSQVGPTAQAHSSGGLGGGLILAGKERALTQTPSDPNVSTRHLDYLYALRPDAVSVDALGRTRIEAGACPAPGRRPGGGEGSIGNGRLVQDNTGRLYQIHHSSGIYQLDRGPAGEHELVVPPLSYLETPGQPGKVVHVGLTPTGGSGFVGEPLADAVIRAHRGERFAYVAPVVVEDTAAGCSWKAGARLRLSGGSPPYVVDRIYGPPGCNAPEAWSSLDRQQPREIELSADGRLVFVASAHAFNQNDYLLVFDEDGAHGQPRQVVSLAGWDSPGASWAPVGLHASGDALYLSSQVRPLDEAGLPSGILDMRLRRLTIQPDGSVCTAGSCGPRELIIHRPCSGPEPPCVPNPNPPNPMAAHVTAVTEHEGLLWVAGYVAPTYRSDEVPEGTDLFTTPLLALMRPEWFDSPPSGITAAALECQHLALPMSVTFLPEVPADFDGDADVDAADYAAFSICLTGPNIAPQGAGCEDMDLDRDADVDQDDFGLFQRCFAGSGLPAAPGCAR